MDTAINSSIRPLAVSDISCWVLFKAKENTTYCIGSLKQDAYIEVNENIHDKILTAISYFNGFNTLDEIQAIIRKNHNFKINISDLYNILCRSNLIENTDESLIEKQEYEKYSFRIFKLGLDKLYGFFNRVIKIINPFFYFSLIILVIGSVLFLRNLQIFYLIKTYKINESYLVGIFTGLVIMYVSIFIHEFFHAIVAFKYGLKPTSIIFSIYLIGLKPVFYLKIPGMYTIKPKERIFIWSAGVYANLLLSCFCMIFYSLIPNGYNDFFALAAIVNIALAVFNISPLLPLDGYFIASTILKKPNLRKGAFKEFKNWFWGKENKFRGISIIYFLSSSAFMGWIILTQIHWIYDTIVQSYSKYHSILMVLWDLKIIIFLLLIIIGPKIVFGSGKYLRVKNRLNRDFI